MKMIRNLMPIIIILLYLPAAASSEKLEVLTGSVKAVETGRIKLSIPRAEFAAIGDKVIVYYETSSGLKMEVGEWKISGRDKLFLYATPVNVTTKPIAGLTAVVSLSPGDIVITEDSGTLGKTQATGDSQQDMKKAAQQGHIESKKQLAELQ
jgi:hypothetical protein